MNLQQVRYICEIAKLDFNISAAAAALHTSQPGISKQVRLLETELGMEIFQRSRSRLSGATTNGERIIAMARNIMSEVANIKALSKEIDEGESSSLVVAVTHTQARYVLPEIIKRYGRNHPKVQVSMRHANPKKIIEMLMSGEAEIGITADDPTNIDRLTVIPCRRFQKVVVVPRNHPLLKAKVLTLERVAQYPLVTYEPGFTARRQVTEAFDKHGLQPEITVSAIDADVIKACVEQGLGITVLSEITFNARKDSGLRAIPAGHLFAPSVTKILVCRDHYLRQCARDFRDLFTAN